MNVERYAVCADPDDDAFDNLYNDYEEAKNEAMSIHGVVIALVFVFNDSEMVDDFRKRCNTCSVLLTDDNHSSEEEEECNRCVGARA